MSMATIDLDNLQATDITPTLNALHRFFMAHGITVVTDNLFLKPEQLARRWELSISCLNNWRFTGGGPIYIKTGPGPKANVRYPILGAGGVLEFEQQRCFRSTTEESQRLAASSESGRSQAV